jgi:two-component sensor histidine kinase
MLKIKISALFVFALLCGARAYGQNENISGDKKLYASRLEKLIEKGRRVKNDTDSLQHLVKELEVLHTTFHDKTSLVYADYYRANIAWLAADHYKAMQIAMVSLKNAQKWHIHRMLPSLYALVGNLHKENTNYPMAFIAAQKGLDAAIKNKDTANIIALTGLKAMFKRGYALHFNKPIKNTDSSVILQMQGLKLAESNDKYELLRIRFYNNIGQHFKDMHEYDKAVFYLNKGIALAVKLDEQRSLTYSYNWMGEVYYFTGEKPKGIMYLNKALHIAMALKQHYRTMEIYESISECYKLSGDYKEALNYISKFRWMRDSLNVQNNEKKITELQLKYETAKKDKELAVLAEHNREKNKQMRWLLFGVILFSVFTIILVTMFGAIRRKNRELTQSNTQVNTQAAKLQTLMQELHHRVKNNLQIVSSLLSLQANRMDDSEARNALNISRQRIDAMSVIHNSLYKHDNVNKVNMQEFLPVLLNNILESFGVDRDKMDIRVEVTVNEIDVDKAMPLGLIMNEWITNIFKHAFKDIKVRPAIDILVFRNDDKVKIRIKDNGVGMNTGSWNDPKGSFGIKLMKILIKQVHGFCHVANGDGTTLELDIPD